MKTRILDEQLPKLIVDRYNTASTIFCPQFDVSIWHENIYAPTLVDTICDCIIYDSYTLKIEGKSIRKRDVIRF